jgi:hypothetical protein
MSLDKTVILDELKHLRRKDPRLRLFGSANHQYRLNPPLDEAEVEAFERQHGISLPEDYRCFTTEIGNGGAGPNYGLFPLGKNGEDEDLWHVPSQVGNLAEPFPHDDNWNLPDEFWSQEPDPPPGTTEEEEDRLMVAWYAKLDEQHYFDPKSMNGAVPVSEVGCGLSQWLIVSGPQKGYVWNDYRADYAGLRPLRDGDGKQMTFADWYVAWLESARRDELFKMPEVWPHSMSPHAMAWLLSISAVVLTGVVGWHEWSLATGLAVSVVLVAVFETLYWLRRGSERRRLAAIDLSAPDD